MENSNFFGECGNCHYCRCYKNIDKNCKYCGKEFKQKHHNQIYCCVQCRQIAYQQRRLANKDIIEISKRNRQYYLLNTVRYKKKNNY